jgi:hypothetical protein
MMDARVKPAHDGAKIINPSYGFSSPASATRLAKAETLKPYWTTLR